MMYIYGNNETDKTINVSKIANTSTWMITVPQHGVTVG